MWERIRDAVVQPGARGARAPPRDQAARAVHAVWDATANALEVCFDDF